MRDYGVPAGGRCGRGGQRSPRTGSGGSGRPPDEARLAVRSLEHGGGEDAALLHDAIEDADDGARICCEFGDRIVGIVVGCSDSVAVPGQPKPPWRERKEAYAAAAARSLGCWSSQACRTPLGR